MKNAMDDSENQPFEDERRQAEDLAKAYREVLNSAAGKLVIFDILGMCSIYSDAFAGELHAVTAHSLGRQAVGRQVIGKLDDIDPRIYPQLLFDVADLKAMNKAVQERKAATEDDEDEAV